MTTSNDVAVIGAGIVGVCIAYELRKRGLNVLLIDRDEPGRGCSYGNSGAISSASIAPLAMPGVLRSVPGMIGKDDSPLFLPWQYLPRAVPWLTQFVLSARPERVEQSARRLADIHHDAVALHTQMVHEVGVPELLLSLGHLHVYPDQTAFTKDAGGWRLRTKLGIDFQMLDRDGIVQLEPKIHERYQLGVFMEDQATITNPYRYVQAIFKKFLADGGQFQRVGVTRISRAGQGDWTVSTSDAAILASNVVVAAGIWTRDLLKPLGVKLALEAQRGYHVQFQSDTSPVSRTVVLADKKVFVTPMTEGLRVGGTVEIAGLKASPKTKRADALARIAFDNFKGLEEQPYTTWSGYRPCMPDSVPVIGPVENQLGLYLATGHGHLGLTDSIGTAHRIADMLDADLQGVVATS